VSFFCYTTPGSRPTPYSQQSYMEIGRHCALSFVEYYRLK